MYKELLKLLEYENITIDEVCTAACVNQYDLESGNISLKTFQKILHCIGRHKLQIVKEQ